MGLYEIGDEFVGADPIEDLIQATMGADNFAYDIGAARPSALARAAAASRMAHHGAILKTRGPTKARVYPVGFDSGATLILVGAQATITVRPQIIFRPERFIVPSDIAGNWTIDQIVCGQKSQLVATGSMPARAFQEDAPGNEISLDTVQVGQDLIIQATNVSGAPQRFRAVMFGKAVD